MKNRQIWLISFLLIGAQAWAQTPLRQKLAAALNRLQTDSQCRYASVSLTVLDAKTGEQVFAVNPDMGLAPGSTLKTITSITGFNLLGKDFQYQTQFGYNGTIDANGTLNGDVIIKGGGDPTLGSWRWETTKENHILTQMVSALKKAGIKKINGSIIGDDSIFGTQAIPDGWIWQDIGTYYGGAPAGLCWRENQFDIKFRTGPVGTPVAITRTEPAMPYLTFKSEVVNAPDRTGDQSYPYLPSLNSNLMYVRGTYAIDQTKKSSAAALPDPAFDAAYRLTDTLQRIGITVGNAPQSTTTLAAKDISMPRATNNLITINSPTISSIIYWQNRISINLYAEELLKAIAIKSGKAVSTANGVKALQDFWAAKGIDINSLNIFDGSGLSPGNRVTTLAMARILQSAKKESWFADLYDSLPVYNDMHMKSGSINSCLAYTGYQTHNGRELCFSIIINNYNGPTRSIKDKMFRVLDELK
jgi:D-alanyl-D-alanine carboxypeptidase/D-alanyl-D-alanine-endopeptidase (penicillin-binding protein 4)